MRLLKVHLLVLFIPFYTGISAQHPVDSMLNAVFDSTSGLDVDSVKIIFTDTSRHWKSGGQVSALLSQSAFQYWAAGGEPSLAMNGSANGFLVYKSDSTLWFNDLDISLGFLKKGSEKLKKNDDLIEFTSKYNRKSGLNKMEYTAMMLVQTQLLGGYSRFNDTSKVSGFLSPAYVLTSAGIDYLPFKGARLTIAPVTGKLTMIIKDEIADLESFFNTLLSINKNLRYEFGGFVKFQAEGKITEDLSYKTKLGLFSNYARNPQNIDVDWQTQMNLKISKYISLSLKAHMMYDDDVNIPIDSNGDGIADRLGPRLQLKEILGAGFLWKF